MSPAQAEAGETNDPLASSREYTGVAVTPEQAKDAINALRGEFYEGRPWTDYDMYEGNSGCHAFALLVSDRVFNSAPKHAYYNLRFARTGDVLRVNNGTTNTFQPDKEVTREELAAMLANYVRIIESQSTASSQYAMESIPGAEQVSPWAKEAMSWAVEKGLISGDMSDGTPRLNPRSSALRCQLCKILTVLDRDVIPYGIEVSEEGVTPASDFDCIVFDEYDGRNKEYGDALIDNGHLWLGGAKWYGPGAYIVDYRGTDPNVVVPSEIEGTPVRQVSINSVDIVETIDLSRCRDSLRCLGVAFSYGLEALDVANCPDLREVCVEINSSIEKLSLRSLPALERLRCDSNSNLSSVEIDSLQAIKQIEFGYNPNLEDVSISNCPSLETVTIKSKNPLRATNCPLLKEINGEPIA